MLYLARNDKVFFTCHRGFNLVFCKNVRVCDALSYFMDNIYKRFGTEFIRTTFLCSEWYKLCSSCVAELFLFSYERDFTTSLSDDNQADVIEAFNSKSSYLDDLLNIDNPYFEEMVDKFNHMNCIG